MDERTRAVIEAARKLKKAATVVSAMGAQTGPHWVGLTVALASMSSALTALDAQESAPPTGNCPHCNEQPYNIRDGICGWCDKPIAIQPAPDNGACANPECHNGEVEWYGDDPSRAACPTCSKPATGGQP